MVLNFRVGTNLVYKLIQICVLALKVFTLLTYKRENLFYIHERPNKKLEA